MSQDDRAEDHGGPPRPDPDPAPPAAPSPTHAERARTLLASVRTAALGTVALEPPGTPYTSFVTVAAEGADAILLISGLAEHTRNLRADPRASLLLVEPGAWADAEALAAARVTLLGRASELTRDDAEASGAAAAFLSAHPSAARFAGFRDFAWWRLSVEAVRYIGGFGRMSWVSREDFGLAAPDPLAPAVGGILAHMNEDHAETMVLYARAVGGIADATAARMTGVDRLGFELAVTAASGPRPLRLGFTRPVATPDEVRRELVALARRARGEGSDA
jgi:heme iron utilization protein